MTPRRLIPLATALLLVCSCTPDGSAELSSAYAVGLSVVHPDYSGDHLTPWSDLQQAAATSPVDLDPLPAPPGTHPLTFTPGDATVPPTAATALLRTAYRSGTGRKPLERRKVVDFIAGLDDIVTTSGVTPGSYGLELVVDLDHPRPVTDLTALVPGASRVLFPQMGSAELPLSWSSENCAATPGCTGTDPVTQFRGWLKGLTPDQRDTLSGKPFDLPTMEKTAREGLVAGLMYDRIDPASALKLLRDPLIKAAYVAGVVQLKAVP
ncbi:hypothetical protein [Herbidospora sp. RD11066]